MRQSDLVLLGYSNGILECRCWFLRSNNDVEFLLVGMIMFYWIIVYLLLGYPSDGILQVEEEEEAYLHQEDSDRGTYTVEDEYELRQRYPVNVRSRSSHTRSSRRRPHTHTLREAGNPAGMWCCNNIKVIYIFSLLVFLCER